MSAYDDTFLVMGETYTSDQIRLLVQRFVDANEEQAALELLNQVEAAKQLPSHRMLPHILEQIPLRPDGDRWRTLLMLSGRGAGKTATTRQLIEAVTIDGRDHGLRERGFQYAPGAEVALLYPTFSDALKIMVTDLIALYDELDLIRSRNMSTGIVVLKDGTKVFWSGADRADAGRGLNATYLFVDELFAFPRLDAYENHKLGLRVNHPVTGAPPIEVIATTPKMRPEVKPLMEKSKLVRATAEQNPYLSAEAKEAMRSQYAVGSVRYQLEWQGQPVFASPGALFQLDWLRREEHNPDDAVMTILSVDPSLRGNRDLAGILVISRLANGDIVVEEDHSTDLGPEGWFQIIHDVCGRRSDITTLLTEGNNVNEMLKLLFQARPLPPWVRYVPVNATKSKESRAEAAAIHAEQGRIIISPDDKMTELIEELTTWEPGGSQPSPGRLDALAHGVRHLLGGRLSHKKGIIAHPALSDVIEAGKKLERNTEVLDTQTRRKARNARIALPGRLKV